MNQKGQNESMKPKSNTRKKTMGRLTWTLVGVCCVLGGLTWADIPEKLIAKKQDLAIRLEARKVVRQGDGQETLENAQRAFPGEVIQYDAHYLNQSDQVLSRVSPTLPIPEGMVFLTASTQPAPAEASLDGKTFQSIPLKRRVTSPEGKITEVEVSPTEYRALRWHLGNIPAGATATVSARTQVLAAKAQ